MKKQFSLKTKIIGMVLGVLALVGLGSWWSMTSLSGDYEYSIKDNFKSVAQTAGDRISAQFFERYGDVQAFAMNDLIQSMQGEKMSPELDQYVSLYGIYDVVLVVDKSGHYVSSNTVDGEGKPVDINGLKAKSYQDEPWFQAAMQGRFTEDKSKGYVGTYFEPWVQDSVVKAAMGSPRLGSGFTAPIKDEKGSIVGVITNRAGKRWITREFDGVEESLKSNGAQGAHILLVDAKGILLYAEDPQKNAAFEDQYFSLNLALESPAIKKALNESLGVASEESKLTGAESVVAYSDLSGPKWMNQIGWRVVVQGADSEFLAPVSKSKRNFILFFSLNLFIATAFAVWFSMVLSKKMMTVTSELSSLTQKVSGESNSVAASATELSESSTEQAAALQETVSAVDEILAMVERNADSANKSKDYSNQSRETAEHGKQIVESMLSAISEIDATNAEISDRMDASNQELSEITTLIKEIGAKTKVINDIVFQTKLLSFNAAVEAARAGEYGKGFAVVAEEVGNLAQMSGNAAKEITGLLDTSVKKVETIIGETKVRVEKLMLMSKEKVDAGSKTANECAGALEQILQNVASVDTMVNEIAVASREQTMGIKEISKAVGQMEQVVQQNTAVAQASSASAEQLRAQAASLESSVTEMHHIVMGAESEGHLSEASVAPASAANVVPIQKARKKPKYSKSVSRPAAHSQEPKVANPSVPNEPVKVAAGSDFVPDANDPGFQE